ncbi:MAG: hypothetical protein SFY68_06420 [Candidatus Sumerlaeia bacterium]|nr:hypothetical protein [Candidatus Sumerlaeia bacterium]
MLRIVCTLLTILLFTNAALGCLWDRDTLSAEADGRTEALNAIVGNYDQFPPEFYEARVQRVTWEITKNPDDFYLFDDLGVAWDRLGKSDDAISIMQAKKERMDRLGDALENKAEHEYRYLANIGTFHVHRWFQKGKDWTNKEDLVKGRDFIKQAIELNPDAHFGREKYQLMIVDWLIDLPEDPTLDVLENQRSLFSDDNKRNEANISESITGLTGIITMGAGGESIELFHTLSRQLFIEGRSSVAYLAKLRKIELFEQDRPVLHPGFLELTEEELNYTITYRGGSLVEDLEQLDDWYALARKRVVEANARRMSYLKEMLKDNKHPDTHPELWNRAPARATLPALPGSLLNPSFSQFSWYNAIYLLPVIVLILGIIFSTGNTVSFIQRKLETHDRTQE